MDPAPDDVCARCGATAATETCAWCPVSLCLPCADRHGDCGAHPGARELPANPTHAEREALIERMRRRKLD